MGRDDDSGETPRRAPLASTISGNGSTRTKRTSGPPAVSGGLKYDPAMAASHQVYVSPNDYNTGYANDYQQRSAPYEDVSTVPPGSTSNKRKRKKDREDDWAPAPPPPPPSMVYANNTNDMSMHMAMPTILHRSNTTVPVAPPPQVSVPYETAYASQPHPNTIFNEAPVVIESFTETERRRTNAATSGSGTNSVDMSQLLHGDPMVSATSTPKTTSNGVSSWSSKGVSSGTMSVYDLFFPSPSRPKEANVSSNRNGVRESKRRRRTNGDAAERSSTRASNRRNAITPDVNLDVDMQRFTVDAFKLIPQGLVDRIDTRLRPRMITSLITSHVENWIQRTGFDDQNFLQEVTTLLNVYYPCTHAMILDEVLVAFVFKRPEMMERMMTSIIDRLQKNGESTSPTKYPVVESFARRCGMATSGRISKRDMARHDLACLTVLRLLLERNTEKFMLSPWIASCASLCSNEVLDVMWGALLRPLISSGKTFNDNWNVRDPLDQVIELLREEKQISRFADGGACKLSMSLIKNFVQDEKFVDLRGAPVACEAFENYFGRSTNSSQLVEGWLASEQRYGLSREDALVKIMGVTIDNCSRLSVKKTNWFIKHILGFLTSLLTPRTFDVLVLQHADLFLGGVPKSELEELQSSDEAENGRYDSKIIVGKVSSNEKHAEAGVVAQVGSFLEALRCVPGDTGASVVHTWSEKWCTQGVLVPWSYVWGVLSTAISTASLETLSPVDAAFHEFACRFVKRYVTDILSRDNTPLSLPRVGRMLKTTIQNLSSKHSIALLESVLEGMARLPKSSPLAEKAHSVCAATFAEHIALSGFVGRRGAHQQAGGTSKSNVQERITFLNAVDALVSRHDPLGQLVRDQLIQRRRVGRIILEVIQDGDDVEAGAAVKIMTNVVRVAPSNHLISLWTSSAIENVVTLGYRVRLSSTRRGAIALLNAISHNDGMCNKSLLWTVLRLCTTYCCGCNSQSRAAKLTSFNPETALEFADLVKFILKRAPKDVLADVGVFIQQQIRSCGPSKGQWNLFLVLLLDRIVQVGWSLLSATPKLAHLLLTPFEVVDLSTDFEDRTVQLRALKSLCIALLAESLNQRDHNNLESWLPVARIIVSDQLTSKLKAISSRSACSTSAGLAQSITVLCEDIKESMVAKGLPQDVR